MGEREIDARSDQYSLACMLYEMLAGEPPHTGPAAQAVLAAIVTREPEPLQARRNSVPVGVADAVQVALAKLPADRFESVAQFADALITTTSISRTSTRQLRPKAGVQPAVLVGGAALALVIGSAAGWAGRGTPTAVRSENFAFTIIGDSAHELGAEFALAPDGTLLYRTTTPKGDVVMVRHPGSFDAQPIPGLVGAVSILAVSPDCQRLAFAINDEVRTVRLDGSDTRTVLRHPPANFCLELEWVGDDALIYSLAPGGLSRIDLRTRTTTPVRAPAGSQLYKARMLPNGRDILATNLERGAPWIGVLNTESGAFHPIAPGVSAHYVAPGWLIYARLDGTLMRQPFNMSRADTSAAATALPMSVSIRFDRVADIAIRSNGMLVYLLPSSRALALQQVSADGAVRALIVGSRYWVPRYSPDGRRVAFGAYERVDTRFADLWQFDLNANTDQRITVDGQNLRDFNDPTWGRDGNWLALSGYDPGATEKQFYRVPSDGSTPPVKLLKRAGSQSPTGWTPDGKSVVFVDQQTDGRYGIWIADVDSHGDSNGSARPLVATQFTALNGRLSPDGRWLAFNSDETGHAEVYVQPFPGPGPRQRVSLHGGQMPVWVRGSNDLLYWTGGTIERATLQLRNTVTVQSRRHMADMILPAGSLAAQYDVSPDGKTLVILTPLRQQNRYAAITDLLAVPSR